jgi:hypothetical protein
VTTAGPAQKQPYINNNPKATASEIETGENLDSMAQAGTLKGVSRVEGAAETPGVRVVTIGLSNPTAPKSLLT